MRKHGWQLPYHPLQFVAVAVFLALGFAFYVFFAPFVGNKMYQYIAVALYTPLITLVFGLYIWCAAADPADPGVFKSKKYLKIPNIKKVVGLKSSKLGEESTPSMHDATASTVGGNSIDSEAFGTEGNMKDAYNSVEKANSSCLSCFLVVCSPCAYICRCSGSSEEFSDKQTSEDGISGTMRKHGWQLPYHPLQVVAVAVFLALGFAFYVFFAPFVGNKMYQYIAVALYTPLITLVFGLYIWCAAADPADPGVFKSKKYLKIPNIKKVVGLKSSKLGEESTPSMPDATASTVGGNSIDSEAFGTEGNMKDAYNSVEKANSSSSITFEIT
ncbi:hypothetical protein RYX36_033206 [Vicia faba]